MKLTHNLPFVRVCQEENDVVRAIIRQSGGTAVEWERRAVLRAAYRQNPSHVYWKRYFDKYYRGTPPEWILPDPDPLLLAAIEGFDRALEGVTWQTLRVPVKMKGKRNERRAKASAGPRQSHRR